MKITEVLTYLNFEYLIDGWFRDLPNHESVFFSQCHALHQSKEAILRNNEKFEGYFPPMGIVWQLWIEMAADIAVFVQSEENKLCVALLKTDLNKEFQECGAQFQNVIQLMKVFCETQLLISLQNQIDEELNCFEKKADNIETVVDQIEQNLMNNEACTEMDPLRCTMYQQAEELFLFVTNYSDTINNLKIDCCKNEVSKLNEPLYTLFKVVNSNLNLLDKIAFQMASIQKCLAFIEYLKARIHNRYNTNN